MLTLASLFENVDNIKAWSYFDEAALHQPYALHKMGEFIENDFYVGKYSPKQSLVFAMKFYDQATKKGPGCREALFKLGHYY